MDLADALIFALLAASDLALLSHLRRRRARREQLERIMRSLRVAVRNEIGSDAVVLENAA